MKIRYTRTVIAWTSAVALTVSLIGCGQQGGTGTANMNKTSIAVEQPAATPEPTAAPVGPDMLSTVGDAGEPLTNVAARQGTFAITNIDGIDTLTVNGKPARFKPAGNVKPETVQANSGLSLVGVFDLPVESVAWVRIIGGTACPGTHVLIPAREGRALSGQDIPGCDDRGTMRKVGDKVTFEAGGSEGTYENGLVSVTTRPPDDDGTGTATAM